MYAGEGSVAYKLYSGGTVQENNQAGPWEAGLKNAMWRVLLKLHCQYQHKIRTFMVRVLSRCRPTLPWFLEHFTWRRITVSPKFISSSLSSPASWYNNIFYACDKYSSVRPDIYQLDSCIWDLLIVFEFPCAKMLPQAASFVGEATRCSRDKAFNLHLIAQTVSRYVFMAPEFSTKIFSPYFCPLIHTFAFSMYTIIWYAL